VTNLTELAKANASEPAESNGGKLSPKTMQARSNFAPPIARRRRLDAHARKKEAGKSRFPIAVSSIFASLISLFTGAAYLAGKSYHSAYLMNFHVPDRIITKNTIDYFFYSYLAFRDLPSSYAGTYLLLPVVLLSLVGALLWRYGDGSVAFFWGMLRSVGDKATSSTSAKKELSAVRTVGIVVLGWFALLTFVPGLIKTPEEWGTIAGFAQAEKDREVFREGCEQKKNGTRFCSEIFDRNTSVGRGFIIEVSEKYVVIFEKGAAKVIPVQGKSLIPVITERDLSDCFLDRTITNGVVVDKMISRIHAQMIGRPDCANQAVSRHTKKIDLTH
jgi:hypothetical protein